MVGVSRLEAMRGIPLGMGAEVEVAVAIAIVLAGALLLAVLAVYVRRWLLSKDDEPSDPGGFALSDLRRLHHEGKLSDEEFERAKAQLVSASQRSMTPSAGPTAKPQVQPKDPMNPPAVE